MSHFHHHYLSFIHVFLQREYLSRIESTLGRYKAMVKGYDFAGVTDLYHENQRINEQNKVSDTCNNYCLLLRTRFDLTY